MVNKTHSQYKHGLCNTRQYRIWKDMKKRCDNINATHYKYYGGRGIKYDKKWESFMVFWEDMQCGYSDNLTLDRINNDKGYSKENCTWVTRGEQARNKRTNITYKGETMAEAERRLGLSKDAVGVRIRTLGWSKQKAFTLMSQRQRR